MTVDYWRRPLSVVLAVLLAGLIVSVQVMLFRSYGETERTTATFDLGANVTTVLASVQRETNMMAVEIERLPRTNSLAKVRLRRAFLNQQLLVLEPTERSYPSLRGSLADIRATVAVLDGRLANVGRRAPGGPAPTAGGDHRRPRAHGQGPVRRAGA